MDCFGFLKTRELIRSGEAKHVSTDDFLELRTLADRGKVTLNIIFLCPVFGPGLFRDHDAYATVLERVTVDEALGAHG